MQSPPKDSRALQPQSCPQQRARSRRYPIEHGACSDHRSLGVFVRESETASICRAWREAVNKWLAVAPWATVTRPCLASASASLLRALLLRARIDCARPTSLVARQSNSRLWSAAAAPLSHWAAPLCFMSGNLGLRRAFYRHVGATTATEHAHGPRTDPLDGWDSPPPHLARLLHGLPRLSRSHSTTGYGLIDASAPRSRRPAGVVN